jgi:hypothetical protein
MPGGRLETRGVFEALAISRSRVGARRARLGKHVPERRGERADGHGGEQRGAHDPAQADADREDACRQQGRRAIAVADGEPGDERELDRVEYRPAF